MTGSYTRQNPDVTSNAALAPGTASTHAELGGQRSPEADDVPPPPYQESFPNESHPSPGPPLPQVQPQSRAQAQPQPQPAMTSYPSRSQASRSGPLPPNAYTPMGNQHGWRPIPAQGGTTTTYPPNTYAHPKRRYGPTCAPGMHSYEVQYGVSVPFSVLSTFFWVGD